MPRQIDHRITIRFKPEEYALIQAKAGSKPMAPFMRDLLLRAAQEQRASTARRPIQDKQAIAQVLALLGTSDLVSEFRSVSDRIADGTTQRGEETDARLRRIEERLDQIRAMLMRALGMRSP